MKDAVHGPVAPDPARHLANRIRRATPNNPGLQPPRWRAGHKLTGRRGTDRRPALVRCRSLVRDGGLPWVAKLDIASFFDAIRRGPLRAALRLPRTKVFLLAFNRALERAGIVFLRYLDDVPILAASPEALAAGLGTSICVLESLGMSLMPEKTQAAWLGSGEPPADRLELPVAGEIDFLRIHFLGPERFQARETTVIRLLRKIRMAIVAARGKGPTRQRYFRACRRINELFGYELTGRPVRCRIGKVRYVQPRQHAVLGHSELIVKQMRRVDRTVRRLIKREFRPTLEGRAERSCRRGGLRPRIAGWRIRSAAPMHEMAAQHLTERRALTYGRQNLQPNRPIRGHSGPFAGMI